MEKNYWEALQAFRAAHDLADDTLADADLAGLRLGESAASELLGQPGLFQNSVRRVS